LHVEADPLSLVQGSRDFFDELPKGPGRSELRTYPHLKHEIFNEPERKQIWAEILEWWGQSFE
ncbi:lysophospholipase, partial [Myxococcota bacterium]|nr:lysophospholipase [Myxococcota bacterium]